ncbi:hypothetical protein MJH12_18555, partial [bacterium]|nr:hypothetical protein [bacterium]
MKTYLLLFLWSVSLCQANVIYSGDKIVIQGNLYKALDDYYLQTKEGLNLLVLGDVDFYKKQLKSQSFNEGQAKDGLAMSITGTYHSFTDGAGKEIHAIIVREHAKDLLNPIPLLKEDSEEPYYLMDPPAYSWQHTFHETKDQLKNFMIPYLTYARKVESDYQKNYKDWKALGNHADDYMDSI